MVRGIVAAGRSSGYVLDRSGGLHAFGGAPFLYGTGYWPGQDVARGLNFITSVGGGYVVDDWGGIHPFAVGTNPLPPSPAGGPYWEGEDVARGIAAV